jgi:hypothetical protein
MGKPGPDSHILIRIEILKNAFIVPAAVLKLKADLSPWIGRAALSIGRAARGKGAVVGVPRRLTGSWMVAIL